MSLRALSSSFARLGCWRPAAAPTLPLIGRRIFTAGKPVVGQAVTSQKVRPSSSRSLVKAYATVAAPPKEPETEKSMVATTPQAIYRKDYKPTPFLVDQVYLNFVLGDEVTRVQSKLSLKPNYSGSDVPELTLDGRSDVKLVSIKVGGKALSDDYFKLTEKKLTISNLPSGEFELEIETDIKPQENTSLEGLYQSGGNFCTQCEAEGFRGITFFLDRPDVMAKYTTRIEADEKKYPVLLSNGNLVDSGKLDSGKHFTVWEDPFPKPCYLFALVAGDLKSKKDTFKTMSGKDVELRIYVAENNLPKVDYAMESLKKSMKWDEDVFGLEYDLDLFNIVAVDDFNMGAMENKSLNIFNSRLVLASASTATDMDYARIEGVVAHEYFHNYTGNRVTCRDWFQLTLKEGLTVFRDQEFSSDMNSRAVKRIEDVARLRQAQFPEDAGTMSHPIRPDSYVRMDNFYSATVYEKGAEVVRLYHTLLGAEGFRKGMDLYFKRHDGQAVTCDDFRAAMADANGEDLTGLAAWYSQAGTPQVEVEPTYDSAARTLTLKVSQHTPPTPGQDSKGPVLIPLRTALLGPDGSNLPLHLKGVGSDLGEETVLRLEKLEQTFTFTEVAERPVISTLRGFSAPVKLEIVGQTEEDLVFLLGHDSDSFTRWEAGQVLQRSLLLKLYNAALDASKGSSVEERVAAAGGVPEALTQAFRLLLEDKKLDPALTAAAISLPAASELVDMIDEADPVTLHQVRKYIVKQIAQQLRPELEATIKRFDSALGAEYSPDSVSASKRALKNKALGYLAAIGDPEVTQDLLRRVKEASNMTDEIAAVASLADSEGEERETALEEFYKRWAQEPLVVLKWLSLKAGSNAPGNVKATRELTKHSAFNINNPNNCYSLYMAFCRSHPNFHAEDGSGYEFLADSVIQVDKINRQVAARLVGAFTQWKQYDSKRQGLIKGQIKRILDTEGLSENVFEIASKSLD